MLSGIDVSPQFRENNLNPQLTGPRGKSGSCEVTDSQSCASQLRLWDNSKGESPHPTVWMRRNSTVGPYSTNRAKAGKW
ncbi:MAG: hypothetical protein NVS9B14_18560 [Candidatus Acidiferrum sp.]